MSFLDVSAQLGPGGRFARWRYATVSEVETFWADAGLTGPAEPCGPQYAGAVCFAIDILSGPATEEFISLIGNTWTPNYGFRGAIGLTSTPLSCDPYTCSYYTPEIRIYDTIPDEALVVEGLRDDIADPVYGSWLVAIHPERVPEPSTILLLATVVIGLGCRRWRPS